jgi:hypothetical protein
LRGYGTAIVIFAVVLAGYVWTLAPSVTFWDAGEFLAASKALGVPHPPGTPLFVFLSHAWASIVPFGEYAYRVNLMTAVFSAAAAALLYLVVFWALRGRGRRELPDAAFPRWGAAAAALVSAFAFTVWQNANESEVYMVAAFCIAATLCLAAFWRKHRGTARATHLLLLIVYLGALSVGNHLLALLVGPAVVGFMWHVLRTDPLSDPRSRRAEWAQLMVVAAIWALLIGTGLGSSSLLMVSGVLFLGAAVHAATAGGGGFAVAAVCAAAVGVSTYLFLYIRASIGPIINMSDPSTWDALVAVIRREQYPVRLPMDNPLYESGAANPGRTFGMVWLQIQNYLQYFDWQWSNGLAAAEPVFAKIRFPFTMAFTSLGIYGASIVRRRDRSLFWLLLLTFLITGPGLLGYMNFKPGFSLGFDLYPDRSMHEVRERDYFFTVSFQMWGLFAGIGVAGLYRMCCVVLSNIAITKRSAPLLALPAFCVAIIPFALNFPAASRAHGPDVELAGDFGYDLLQTVEPYAILFTGGDNDTYPLWYKQVVEGMRPDVTVVVQTLSNTDWFVRQLRDRPVQEFEPDQAPWFANLAPDGPPPPIHSLTDNEIASLRPLVLPQPLRFRVGSIDQTYPARTVLRVQDIVTLRLIQENWDRRPIYFASSAGGNGLVRLGDSLVQEGLAYRLYVEDEPDTDRLTEGLFGIPVDLPRTDSLAWNVYRYAGLFDAETLALDRHTNGVAASNLSQVFLQLAHGYDTMGDRERSLKNLSRAYHLNPDPGLLQLLQGRRYAAPPLVDTPPEDIQ